ncbi:MAG: hypothetical protein HUK18_07460 [Bacteroidales bacterium]|nr:hypothetical protein [Bacteroidales bacterium]
MKRLFLFLLLLLIFIPSYAINDTDSIYLREKEQRKDSVILKQITLKDGLYQVDCQTPFVLRIRGGEVVSFIDVSTGDDLISELIDIKFYKYEDIFYCSDYMYDKGEDGKYEFTHMARTRRWDENEWEYWTVAIGTMQRGWIRHANSK